ncbi:CPBP family intramembrane glutamic endopeptidase [Dokdonia sp. Hel_I_53]|uniref:CPBP family intramembrane glutamic endopeptidase n=1 Tax=Dokdonia sp. Hel_I_53 TaxID=1566287 RepID=UPI0011998CF1|nr:CPBP family intramembrane glutamic endopeptidase [Dokdonia sp. Hel_I_53]TVZ51844.1 CAAX prenyl protease-like protein [Dokdonia sp. Hel_I_53]
MIKTEKLTRLLVCYFLLWGAYILFLILHTVLKYYYPQLFEEEYEQHFLKAMLTKNPLRLFILAVIFAPIIEEMMFRTLIKPSHDNLILLICSWPVFFLNKMIPSDVNWIVQLVFIAVLIFVSFYVLRQLIPQSRTLRIRRYLDKYVIVVLLISSLIFGIVHINNYVKDFTLNIALITLIFPRIMAGIMMGYVKIKNDHIGWSMALHSINNGFVILILIISKSLMN